MPLEANLRLRVFDHRSQMAIFNVLSIAGVDPSGGAGLIADLKVFSALGVYGCGVVTALTAQNTRMVAGIKVVDEDLLQLQLSTLFDDVHIDVVKIGMLADSGSVRVVASALDAYRPRYVVLDPVMVAKSGDRLLETEAVDTLRQLLVPRSSIVTPNLPEVSELLRHQVSDEPEGMLRAAEDLVALGAGSVLVKGGHGRSSMLTDVLFDGFSCTQFVSERVLTRNTHGTGCTLSSAIAALLPQRENLVSAVSDAHRYVAGAIRAADELSVGGGHGPLHHFFAAWRQ